MPKRRASGYVSQTREQRGFEGHSELAQQGRAPTQRSFGQAKFNLTLHREK
jgi:hypothetical protein